MYVNDYDSGGDCAKRGKYAEDCFVDTALSLRYKVRKATREEQYRHIDYILTGIHPVSKKEISVSVDVKGKKKHNRKGQYTTDIWIWLEMRNVQGKPGWIFGDAHFIAFERNGDFVVVKRESLQRWVEASGRIRYDLPYVTNSWEAKYRVYTRRGRSDQITMVQLKDILKLDGCYIWKKLDA